MADAFVQGLGTTNGTATTSLVLTVGGTTTAGNTVIVGVIHHAFNATVSAVDSQGNTYQVDEHMWDTVSAGVTILSSHTTAALTSGVDTITVNFTGSVNNTIMYAYEFSGLKASAYFDVGSTNHASGNSPTSGTATTTQADDLLFSIIGWNNSSASVSAGSGYTKLDESDNYRSSTDSVLTEYQLVEATGTYAGTATLTGSPSYQAAFASYKAATAAAPVNTVAPVVSGTSHVGQALSTTNGTWTDDGSPTFTYQWQRDNSGGGVYSNISAATSSTYTLVAADDGCQVRCVVTDSTPDGSTGANSNALAVTYAAPTNTVAPVVTGSATVGALLSCDTGTWTT